ncbi:hypothetical protein BGZ72_005809 [Mortierella alpina]|nr:hypothetical protein BGZ72_005809 [Mortierella alpina]
MSLRLVSSAKNLREQFKGTSSSHSSHSNQTLTMSSGSSIFTASSGISHARTLDPAAMNSASSILSRQGTILRTSSGGQLRRSKSMQKKTLISKVFADDSGNDSLPDLSMEMTLLIVKRCIKEIRERGLTTKGILRQVQMGQSQRVITDTIRLILDDDASTELSALRQLDIHLVAHAMKWAIRYSEETLVTYDDYQVLYLQQDRSFSRFVRDLPPTNRAILLDLFSLCADVTLLAHLNGMTLVSVAKAISLSIMAEPEGEFTTFDASLQQRNQWGAACEDLLRAFLRIKTTHDLAKIEQEDEVDENRYVDNITREVRSARQRSNENGHMPSIPMHARADISVPSSAGSSIMASSGWPSSTTPTGVHGRPSNNYFEHVPTPRSASPHSQQSLSRTHSLAQSTASRSRPLSPAPFYEQDRMEYEEIMQDQSHLVRLRHPRQSMILKPGEKDRRRSSVADMESLYMLPVDSSTDGYESEPEPMHDSLVPDFADGLGWDFSKLDALNSDAVPTSESSQYAKVNRSNSSSTQGGSSQHISFSDQPSTRFGDGVDQLSPTFPAVQRSSTTRARGGQAVAGGYTSPSMSPQRAKRNSLLRRSVSLDPHTMHGRVHKRPNELRHDILSRELAIQAERAQVAEDIRARLLEAKQSVAQDKLSSPALSAFSLESSPQDLERPCIPSRSASKGLGRTVSKSGGADAKLAINVGGLPQKAFPAGTVDELTPVSNPSSSSSIASPKPQHPRGSQEHHSHTDKKFEVISRPKDIEVSMHITPITPVSPKAEMRSKFHENFSDTPVAPPPGYGSNNYHKRSPATASSKSGQSSKMSPSSSTMSSPMQPQSKPVSRSNSKGQIPPSPLPLQTTTTGASSASSQPPTSESKSKAAGFIRALSFKLRSKQSDEQLKPVKINNHVVNAVPAVPQAPAVSIQPPRLELSFLGDLGASGPTSATANTTASKASAMENGPALANAPAKLLQLNASNPGTGTPESWKRAAQATLPVPELPKGFTGARRSSGTLFGSGNVALREQRRKSRMAASSPRSPANHSKTDSKRTGPGHASSPSSPSGRKSNRIEKERTSSDSYTTDDGSILDDSKPSKSPVQLSPASPKKAGEREYRFSTATLLKDGKLYYQLQWDEFSEAGFKSDFFHQPEQYLTGLHQKRKSKAAVGGPGMNSSPSAGKSKLGQPPTTSTTSWDHAPSGPLGQDQDQVQGRIQGQGQGQGLGQGQGQDRSDSGPSREQRAAAMKAARESFMALAKDPKALAALKAGSTGGIGQATIIGTGSFPIGSAQPVLHSPLNLNWNPVPPKSPSRGKATPSQPGPLDKTSNSSSSRALLPVNEDDGKHQKNTLGKSSPTLSAAGTASQGSKTATAKPGKPSIIAGGAGSLSLSPEPNLAVDNGAPAKPAKKSRLFGSRFKASSKKNNRLSTQGGFVATTSGGIGYGGKKKQQQRLLPMGVMRKDVMTKTEESLDEVFPWTCIEHMAGQDSGWVMLEPVQDGAVGWVKIDKLEEEMARLAESNKQQQQQHQQQQQQQHEDSRLPMMQREQ